jgi:uncharacterized protein (AIM24 family)
MHLASLAPSAPPVTATLDTAAAFFAGTLEPEKGRSAFEVVDHRLVRIEVDDFVWIKRGTLIAYHGNLTFRLEEVFQPESMRLTAGPVRSALKREAVPLSRATGRGCVFLSDEGRYNRVLRLERQRLFVASQYLLAFQPTLQHEVRLAGGVGALSGGIFVVQLAGTGFVAISSKGDPLTLRVTPDDPVSTDPTATVAWTSGLWPELKTDLDVRSLAGHGGGAPLQMLFGGEGYVVVNARSRMEAVRSSIFQRMRSKLARVF